jgi:predicted nucleic acid-binding protein
MSFTIVRFVDTNVLIYAVSRNPAERTKAECAAGIIAAGGLGLSAQVLQEFYVQVTRASRPFALDHGEAQGLIEGFLRFPVQSVTGAVVTAAIVTRERFQISYWDAAIVEAARSLGCDRVLTEDLSDGMDYAGVRVENPFRGF